ncbi:unnamed protein product [Lactuca saligna]|uniref:Uncharacterized protein n=1 Tax=Lactuca saligna TaxID=75948 RepID=A0AA36A6E0_LACSI|nr:unnamed protein product [Lactuca saligna]
MILRPFVPDIKEKLGLYAPDLTRADPRTRAFISASSGRTRIFALPPSKSTNSSSTLVEYMSPKSNQEDEDLEETGGYQSESEDAKDEKLEDEPSPIQTTSKKIKAFKTSRSSKTKRSEEYLEDNVQGIEQASTTPDGDKKGSSRSARRKKAKRQWKRELTKISQKPDTDTHLEGTNDHPKGREKSLTEEEEEEEEEEEIVIDGSWYQEEGAHSLRESVSSYRVSLLSSAFGRLVISSDGVWDALSTESALECSCGLAPESAATQIVKKALPKTTVVMKQVTKEKEHVNVDFKSKNNYFYVPSTTKVDLVDSFKSQVRSCIKDRAADAEVNAIDNQIPESTKYSDLLTLSRDSKAQNSTSHSSGNSESMPNDQVEVEHLQSTSHVEGEHSFEWENRRMDDDVEGEQHEIKILEGELNMSNNNQDETFHDLNDTMSVVGSETKEMFEDAPLHFDPTYPPMDKWFLAKIINGSCLQF